MIWLEIIKAQWHVTHATLPYEFPSYLLQAYNTVFCSFLHSAAVGMAFVGKWQPVRLDGDSIGVLEHLLTTTPSKCLLISTSTNFCFKTWNVWSNLPSVMLYGTWALSRIKSRTSFLHALLYCHNVELTKNLTPKINSTHFHCIVYSCCQFQYFSPSQYKFLLSFHFVGVILMH